MSSQYSEYGGREAVVTGGAGFIGSNLAHMLVNEGVDVTVIDDLSFGVADYVSDSRIELVERSVLDEFPESMFDVDTVYHLAAMSSTKMHEDDPVRGVEVNVDGFVNILDHAYRAGADNVVYASSSTVYGNPSVPTDESEPYDCRGCYPASKAAREHYATAYREKGLDVAGARLFSVYQGYGYREGHKGEHSNVISMFADDIAQGTRPVVYGDGSQTRNFTHVSDSVRALAAMAGLNGEYNVCAPDSHTFNTVVELINDVFGTDVSPKYIDPPLDGEYISVQDGTAEKLRRDSGWVPTMTIERGIRRVCMPYLD